MKNVKIKPRIKHARGVYGFYVCKHRGTKNGYGMGFVEAYLNWLNENGYKHG